MIHLKKKRVCLDCNILDIIYNCDIDINCLIENNDRNIEFVKISDLDIEYKCYLEKLPNGKRKNLLKKFIDGMSCIGYFGFSEFGNCVGFGQGQFADVEATNIISEGNISSDNIRVKTGIPKNRTDVHLCSLVPIGLFIITNNKNETHWKNIKEKKPMQIIEGDNFVKRLSETKNFILAIEQCTNFSNEKGINKNE